MTLLKKALLLIFAITLFSAKNCPYIFCQETNSSKEEEAEPYLDNEFPEWAKTVRRAEIVTLGSVPFTTLGVILVYGTYQYAKGESVSFPNPFDSSQNYSESQIKSILGWSLATSCVIGLTDITVNFIKKKSAQKKIERINASKEQPAVTPISPEEAGEILRKESQSSAEEGKGE